ncbi:uncharacterized protein LOC126781174 [Nymphalis io]|uniref:uncharacterized protein LOC126781174 n=1 Tax=Inachis io TaxID=171585 RepID=UPI002167CB89|nr:uncharacterized protein LOC126781174 [Nymphalis io]
MDRNKEKLKSNILSNNESEIKELLENGFDPNFENGWPIRLAARFGFYSIVKLFIQYGANPHSLNEAGASTLQLAVFSGLHWETDDWTYLLSCCDSSQLADGAAVAIIFNNIAALQKILCTGRCNTNIPTTLTGKTVEDLAKGYKMQYILNFPVVQNILRVSSHRSPPRMPRSDVRNSQIRQQNNRNLSPSVARFFNLTAGQTALSPPQSPLGSIFPSRAQ